MKGLKKCIIVIAGLVILIIDYLLASREYANFLETYGSKALWGVISPRLKWEW